jgi:dihydrofolate reductase
MRRLIAGMKISLDAKYEGPDGMADWVEAWSEDYGLTSLTEPGVTPSIDACLLGAGMYPGYEGYWTGIQNEPTKSHWITGKAPTPGELAWARFAAETPHYVLSSTLDSAKWPKTRFLRTLEDVAALKAHPGKDIYLIGGGRTTTRLIDAGIVDELRLLVYPLIAGGGKALFANAKRRRPLQLRSSRALPDGRMSMIYGVGGG